MFWRKKPSEQKTTEAKPKAKKESPVDIIIKQIEQLVLGQSLSYRLPEVYGGDLAILQLNPDYPEKGRKYTMFSEKLVDGKPCGKRTVLWYSNDPRGIARWICDRSGVLFS